MKMKKTKQLISVLTILLVTCCLSSFKTQEAEKIQWHSFTEAMQLNQAAPKKIFIDVYTEWCGWCKRMDATTFTNPVIIRYMNAHFYAVKLDAEMKDTVLFSNHTFVNPDPTNKRSTHQLASALLNNKLSYPTAVYLDENFSMLGPVPGYQTPEALEPILHFFGSDAYKSSKWEDYQKTFKTELKPQ